MSIVINEFQDKDAKDFLNLGLEWLNDLQLLEDYDLEVLNNPHKKILNGGGQIFFANDSETGQNIGTVSLMKIGDGEFEIVKMGVTKSYKSKGIGKDLMEHAIKHAKQMNAKRLVLFTNEVCVPACALYKKLGFVQLPVDETSPYEIADIMMEMMLNG